MTTTSNQASPKILNIKEARTPFRVAMSRALGNLADLRVPRGLRSAVFRAWAATTGSDLSAVLLPIEAHCSLGAFFVRRLSAGERRFPDDPGLIAAPVDGVLQALDAVADGQILQAKGRSYAVRDMLAGMGSEIDLEGGLAITLYLAPRDYHRIHAPTDADLVGVKWIDGTRYSVRPRVLAGRPGVLAGNERAVLHLETRFGPLFLVLVGALNVGRIRIVGVPYQGSLSNALRFRQGDEFARFEMGSTVVALLPKSVDPIPTLSVGLPIRMGNSLARAPASLLHGLNSRASNS